MDAMEKKRRRETAERVGAQFVAGMKDVLATAKAGGLRAVRAKYTLRTAALAPFELPAITRHDVVAARDALGVSQPVFAKILGVSAQSVKAWEQGTKPPSGIARRLIGEICATPEHWRKRFGLERAG